MNRQKRKSSTLGNWINTVWTNTISDFLDVPHENTSCGGRGLDKETVGPKQAHLLSTQRAGLGATLTQLLQVPLKHGKQMSPLCPLQSQRFHHKKLQTQRRGLCPSPCLPQGGHIRASEAGQGHGLNPQPCSVPIPSHTPLVPWSCVDGPFSAPF